MHDPARQIPALWSLLATGNDNLGVSPVDLAWFDGRFDARPMGQDWRPLPLELVNRSKKLRDFVSWTVGAPLVSLRAREAIEALGPGAIEFLPFHPLKGKPYFAMNVLQTADVLDLEASDVLRDSRFTHGRGLQRPGMCVHPAPAGRPAAGLQGLPPSDGHLRDRALRAHGRRPRFDGPGAR